MTDNGTHNPDYIETKPITEVQCQGCGICRATSVCQLPAGWAAGDDGLWYCQDCADEEPRPLLGSDYDPEFDPDSWRN